MAQTPPTIDLVRAAVREELEAVQTALTADAIRAAALGVTAAQQAAMHGVLHAIASLLAVRLLLLVAFCGAFVLAVMALRAGTYAAAGVLVAYAVLIVVPLVWLERNPRVGPKP